MSLNAQTQETNIETVSGELKEAILNNDRDTIAEALEKGDLSVAEYEAVRNSSRTEPKKEETAQAETAKDTETEGETDTSTEQESVKPEEVTAETDEAAKLRKQVEDKEKFIQERNAEIGNLRKKTKELEEKLSKYSAKPVEMTDEDWTKYNENPKAFVKSTVEEEQRQKQEAEAKFREEEKIFLDLFTNKVKVSFKDAMPEMVNILKEDGLPEEIIEGFKADPYQNGGAFLIQLGMRAADRKRFNITVENKETKAKELAARTNSRQPAVTSKATNSTTEGVFTSIASAFKSGGRDALAELIDRGEATTAEVKEWLSKNKDG